MSPEVSVIIPAYNQSSYLPASILSVLNQSYSDWELIVVDDGSTDSCKEVVSQFSDPRIRYVYQQNSGLPIARNTGIQKSSGKYIAFLDADDLYHSRKLEAHVNHLDSSPAIGLSYGSRLEIDKDGNALWFFRTSDRKSLKEMVLGFPFTINDICLRREWIDITGGFDPFYSLHGEDRDFYFRLAVEGCLFGGIDQVVASRRVHAKRIFNNVQKRLDLMLLTLDNFISDQRCPPDLRSFHELAQSKIFLYWACQAYAQNILQEGQGFLEEAIKKDPLFLTNGGRSLLDQIVWFAVRHGDEHEPILVSIFSTLPRELSWNKDELIWAIGRGYLIRGLRDAIWGRMSYAASFFAKSAEYDSRLDDRLLGMCVDQLVAFEAEYGPELAQSALNNLSINLRTIKQEAVSTEIFEKISINRINKYFQSGNYRQSLIDSMRAVYQRPQLLANKGFISISLRSAINTCMKLDTPKAKSRSLRFD